jgi:hypothetical protein
MRKARSIPIIAFIATFSSFVAASPPALENFRLTLGGLGPIRIGMTLKEVEDAGVRIKIDNNFDPNECAPAEVIGQRTLRLMFEEGRVSRIEIYGDHIATLSGARVGYTEEKVSQIYGRRLTVQPHKYDDLGHYMILLSTNKKYALVMETDGKVVTEFRAGFALPAQYVEGCL